MQEKKGAHHCGDENDQFLTFKDLQNVILDEFENRGGGNKFTLSELQNKVVDLLNDKSRSEDLDIHISRYAGSEMQRKG